MILFISNGWTFSLSALFKVVISPNVNDSAYKLRVDSNSSFSPPASFCTLAFGEISTFNFFPSKEYPSFVSRLLNDKDHSLINKLYLILYHPPPPSMVNFLNHQIYEYKGEWNEKKE